MLKRLFLNAQGKISLTKIGGTIVTVSGAILTLPMAAQQAGIAINIPNGLMIAAWMCVFIGGKLGIDGARDALDKK